jgi:hypothetical protein
LGWDGAVRTSSFPLRLFRSPLVESELPQVTFFPFLPDHFHLFHDGEYAGERCWDCLLFFLPSFIPECI